MTNKEFENYLALVSRLLRLKRKQTDQIAVELRDHLEMRVAELTESGLEADEATRQALGEFGDAASLASQFQFISESHKRRWAMRFATLSVAGLFLVTVLAMAMWPENARFGSPDSVIADNGSLFTTKSIDDKTMSDSSKRTEAVRKQLQTVLDFDFDEVEAESIFDSIRDQLQINIVIDYSARDDSFVGNQPIKMRMKNVPVSQFLNQMLKEHNATYVVHSGVVLIISLDVADDPRYFTRRMIDVSELLSMITKHDSHRIGTFRRIHRGGVGGRGRGFGGGGGVFCYQDVEQTNASEEVVDESGPVSNLSGGLAANVSNSIQTSKASGGRVQEAVEEVEVTAEMLLEELIMSLISPDSWNQTSGDGTIQIIGGLLIIRQSEEVGDSIEELLQDLSYQLEQREKKSN